MVPRAAPGYSPGASIASPQPLLRDSPLFASFQQVVALMSRGSLEQLPARLAQLLHALPLCAAAPQAPHHASALLFQCLAMDLPASPSLDKLAHDSALRKRDRYPRRETRYRPDACQFDQHGAHRICENALTRRGSYRRRWLSGWLCRSEPFP